LKFLNYGEILWFMKKHAVIVLAHEVVSPDSIRKDRAEELDRVTIDCLREGWEPSEGDHSHSIYYAKDGFQLFRFLLEGFPGENADDPPDWVHVIGGGVVFPKGQSGWRDFATQFADPSLSFFDSMIQDLPPQASCMTHLMNRKKGDRNRVYFHPQWLSIKWQWWIENLGKLKEFYLERPQVRSTYVASEEYIHTGYTPIFMYKAGHFESSEPTVEIPCSKDLDGIAWTDLFVLSTLEAGGWIHNLSEQCRGLKHFLYTDVEEKIDIADNYLSFQPGRDSAKRRFQRDLGHMKESLFLTSRAGSQLKGVCEIPSPEDDGYLLEAMKSQKMSRFLEKQLLDVPGLVSLTESSTTVELPCSNGSLQQQKDRSEASDRAAFIHEGKQRLQYEQLGSITNCIENWFEECESIFTADLFVPHRAGNYAEGWKSFVLHGLGYDKSSGAQKYGFTEQEAPYEFTEEAKRFAPSICEFFSSIEGVVDTLGLDASTIQQPLRFGRVRIMLLESGGFIAPHNDTPGLNYSPRNPGAVNISINHPEGCHFFSWKGKKVSAETGSAVLPFHSGAAFRVNVSCAHSVINNSDQNRYHLILHFR
jgi:hypothetical protein